MRFYVLKLVSITQHLYHGKIEVYSGVPKT